MQQRVFSSAHSRALRILGHRACQGFPAARRHRPEVRRAPPEARDRPTPGASAVEPDRHRPGARRRPDPRGSQRRSLRVGLLQGSRGHAGLRDGANGGHRRSFRRRCAARHRSRRSKYRSAANAKVNSAIERSSACVTQRECPCVPPVSLIQFGLACKLTQPNNKIPA